MAKIIRTGYYTLDSSRVWVICLADGRLAVNIEVPKIINAWNVFFYADFIEQFPKVQGTWRQSGAYAVSDHICKEAEKGFAYDLLQLLHEKNADFAPLTFHN